MSQLFTSGGQSVGASVSVLPMSIQGWFLLEWTGLISLMSKGLSSAFSSTTVWKHHSFGTQLSYGPTLTSVHDYWKNHSFNYIDLLLAKWCLCFLICYVCHSFSSKEQASFNFMAAVTVRSDFGTQENKVCHCFHIFPIHLPWSDGTRCHNLSFLNVEFEFILFVYFQTLPFWWRTLGP